MRKREDYAQQDPLSLRRTRRTMRNRTLSPKENQEDYAQQDSPHPKVYP